MNNMRKTKKYEIRLASKNEGIDYIDYNGIYRFNIFLKNKEWKLYVPGSFGDNFEKYNISREEEEIIITRIVRYLKKIKWLGLFTRTYEVKIIRNGK